MQPRGGCIDDGDCNKGDFTVSSKQHGENVNGVLNKLVITNAIPHIILVHLDSNGACECDGVRFQTQANLRVRLRLEKSWGWGMTTSCVLSIFGLTSALGLGWRWYSNMEGNGQFVK
jgi:hypothetical protein